MKISLLIYTLLSVLPISAGMQAAQPTITAPNITLPITKVLHTQYSLVITIPEGFNSLQSQAELDKKNPSVLQFVPKGENANSWSEIITINTYLGKNLPASSITSFIKDSILDHSSNGKNWLDQNETLLFYDKASLGLSYDLDGIHGVIGAQYYSGPDDCVGLQYIIRPSKTSSDKDSISKIDTFFNSCVHVVNQQTSTEQINLPAAKPADT